jgi:hypothetical protein
MIAFFLYACNNKQPMNKQIINNKTLETTRANILEKHPNTDTSVLLKGIKQAAYFWTLKDGSDEDFINFCVENYLPDDSSRIAAMKKIARNLEILNGNFNKMTLGLKEPLNVGNEPLTNIDNMFGAYDASSHLNEDFFQNKISFFLLLNYPFYSLKEKTEKGKEWNREKWAMARLGDATDSRIPSELLLKYSDIQTQTDNYISEYNIVMGKLVNDRSEKLFPADMKLISHWGLRDELKANYNTERGLEKQRIIFSVMNHIINQDIPQEVINSEKYEWNPVSNTVTENGKSVTAAPEPDTRYDYLLQNFQALKAIDPFSPFYPTYIKSKFESEMEIPQEDVERLFVELVSAPQIKKVASLISKRIGRNIEPFDIWYDGFKPRNSINTSDLDKPIREKYPNAEAFEKNIPDILVKLGFTPEKAQYIGSKIQVDAARGSGHAWGAQMKGDKAHLRTRLKENGMDYKGFNIAMHELGHCVEQTLTLYDIDQYLLNGVPNTAFTEALAFVFQKRDLDILGINDSNPLKNDLMALDIFWSNYEIMGVSLVDMNVWKWLYEHPNATKSELKQAVISIAKDVWNKYYADVFGVKDQPILAIYSHMINYPLYLSAYPIGHLIDFQIEKQIEGKNFGDEICRIYSKGRIIPQQWMKDAVGEELSNKPLLEAVDKALNKVKK